ncbi:MAG TPA: hypothetical protein VMW31_03010, partial [Devosiaceae bacterium]|nr:hypothetical protein [Devosiaceae bacterium]
IGKRKAVSLYRNGELDTVFSGWPAGVDDLLVQARFDGDRYNVYFGALEGKIVRELHSRSLRTDRWDGSGQTIDGVVVAPVGVHSEMLDKVVAALGYTGVGCAQFLFDPSTGQSCFLEINPRFGASYAFVERAGFDLTGLALELAEPTPAPRPLRQPPRPLRFVWTYGDLSGLRFSVQTGDVTPWQAARWAFAAFAAAIAADVHVTWSWSDPGPTLSAYLGQIGNLIWRHKNAGAPDRPAISPQRGAASHGDGAAFRPAPAEARRRALRP